MLRPYSGRNGVPLGVSRGTMNEIAPHRDGVKTRRRLLWLVLILTFVSLLAPGDLHKAVHSSVRNLGTKCIYNVYAATPDIALNMPAVPLHLDYEVPSYIALCQEWMQRRVHGDTHHFRVAESMSICMDWTGPHYSLMEMASSSLLASLAGLDGVTYRHDCARTRTWDEVAIGCDRTTFQQVLQIPSFSVDTELMHPDMMYGQCKVLLHNYKNQSQAEANRQRAFAFHHPFAWPVNFTIPFINGTANPARRLRKGIRGVNRKLAALSGSFEGTDVTYLLPTWAPDPVDALPFSAVVGPLVSRFRHAATEWMNVTGHPTDELNSGVIIYIDPGSHGMDVTKYKQYIDATGVTPSSISVLTGPLCAGAISLPTGQMCLTYANELVAQLKIDYPSIAATSDIKFQISCSTAASFSRMIRSRVLLCPPQSPSCLLPALSKIPESQAVLLETRDHKKPSEFFSMTGHQNRAHVIELTPAEVPEETTPAPAPLVQQTTGGEPVADVFVAGNQQINDAGNLINELPPEPEPYQVVETVPEPVLYETFIGETLPALDPVVALEPEINPAVQTFEQEKTPSPQQIETAVDNLLPIDVNTQPTLEEQAVSDNAVVQIISTELAMDSDLNMTTSTVDEITLSELYTERYLSTERIQEANDNSTTTLITTEDSNVAGANPAIQVEVFCPDITPDNSTIEYTNDGTVITYHQDGNVTVSDGAGTATYHNDSLSITVQDIEYVDGVPQTTVQNPYNHSANVTFTGHNITVNANRTGVVDKDPVGVIIYDNTTTETTIVTQGGTGTLTGNGTQTVYKGNTTSTGKEDTPKGTVVIAGDHYEVTEGKHPTSDTSRQSFNDNCDGGESSESSSESSTSADGLNNKKKKENDPLDEKLAKNNGFPTGKDKAAKDKKLNQTKCGLSSSDEGGSGSSSGSNSKSGSNDKKKIGTDSRDRRLLPQPQQQRILVPASEFKFGNADDLQRICHIYRERQEATGVLSRELNAEEANALANQQTAAAIAAQKEAARAAAVIVEVDTSEELAALAERRNNNIERRMKANAPPRRRSLR